jgi:hypothetical protein
MLKSLFVILLFFNALGAFSLHSQSINDSKQMEKPPLDVEDRQQKLLQAPGWAESSSPGDTSELMTAVNSVAVLEFAQVKRIVQQLDELTESDDLSLAERLALTQLRRHLRRNPHEQRICEFVTSYRSTLAGIGRVC